MAVKKLLYQLHPLDEIFHFPAHFLYQAMTMVAKYNANTLHQPHPKLQEFGPLSTTNNY
jgi:hypothetical protein